MRLPSFCLNGVLTFITELVSSRIQITILIVFQYVHDTIGIHPTFVAGRTILGMCQSCKSMPHLMHRSPVVTGLTITGIEAGIDLFFKDR